jgi:fructose-1,6-bisphosphatase/sedoheptulose 1,7-bisphosphatase-like protein
MQLEKLSTVAEILIANKVVNIYHFSADSLSGHRVWYVLALSIDRHTSFLSDIQNSGVQLNLKEYGHILASGVGETAPTSVIDALYTQYGITLAPSQG